MVCFYHVLVSCYNFCRLSSLVSVCLRSISLCPILLSSTSLPLFSFHSLIMLLRYLLPGGDFSPCNTIHIMVVKSCRMFECVMVDCTLYLCNGRLYLIWNVIKLHRNSSINFVDLPLFFTFHCTWLTVSNFSLVWSSLRLALIIQ